MASFTISLSGDGDGNDVKDVFENTVRALRTVGATVTGSLSAFADGAAFSESADAVPDEVEPADDGDDPA